MIEKLKAWAREPLVHFLLIGVLIYALFGILAGDSGSDDERTITVTSGDIQALTDQWTRVWRRPPTEDELTRILREHVRTRILYREAVAMGLDKGDTVIERRLAQKVELMAQSLVAPEEPTDEVLWAWYTENAERFRQPDLYTITHVFFNPDRREATALDDAKSLLAQFRASNEPPTDVANYGDRFMLQNYYPDRSEIELRKLFGTGFTEQVIRLEPGIWHGPILSGYGTHLVLVNDKTVAAQPPFDVVREQVREMWLREQVNELSERFIENLVSRHDIVVEETEVPLTIPGSGGSQ